VVQPAQRRSRVFPRPAPGGGASISDALAAERAERLR
jgi:hypothetical protein